MDADLIGTLEEIGRQLDRHVFPVVKDGGIVVPSAPAVSLLTSGTENHNGSSAKGRSETGSRTGSAGGQGTAGRQAPRGSRPSGGATPVVRADLQAIYDTELGKVQQAYPGTLVWHQDRGLWLLTRSSLLAGCGRYALFLTGILYSWQVVRSWGFWQDLFTAATWIGPRHTNFPDGSVCAFEPTDNTWVIGDPAVRLLDLYTVWAVRHLHLQVFGRWPGRQTAHHPYERVLELRDDEYCGCLLGDRLYGDCCRDKDLRKIRVADAVSFIYSPNWVREPPEAVVRFVRQEKKEPPRLDELLVR